MIIQVNSHQRLNWTLEDQSDKVVLESSNDGSGAIDGIIIGVADRKGKASTWLAIDEAKSLRDWLVATLP
jgi:hypothetical protein